VDPRTMDPMTGPINRPAAICVAAVVDGTRLIDNVLLAPGGDSARFISHLEPQPEP